MKKTYRIIRNDGRDVLRYSFTRKREAEQVMRKLCDETKPFTYRVQEVKP